MNMTRDTENQPGAVEKALLHPTNSLLAEDVLLLLFQPDSGTIAGESTLYYVLGGAVVAELALSQQAEARRSGPLVNRIHALGEKPPSDNILQSAWSYIAEKPRDVHTVLAALGPQLREPVLNRLVERGDLNRNRKKVLGLFNSTSLTLGSNRREQLLSPVRAALIDGEEPEPRTAATIALLSASGTLSHFHREIPWSGQVFTRGKEIENGNWGAVAAGLAVARTMTAVVMNPVIIGNALSRD